MQEIANSKRYKEDLEKVLVEPAMSKSDLDTINNEVFYCVPIALFSRNLNMSIKSFL